MYSIGFVNVKKSGMRPLEAKVNSRVPSLGWLGLGLIMPEKS